MEAPAEIKVKTRKFSLTKGTIKISFELEGSRGRIRSLKLKQRNAVLDTSFPFEMQTAKKGNTIVYHAQINVDQYPMETAFWDVVASVDKEGKGNYEDAIKAFQNALNQSLRKVGEKEIDICFYKAQAQYLSGAKDDA